MLSKLSVFSLGRSGSSFQFGSERVSYQAGGTGTQPANVVSKGPFPGGLPKMIRPSDFSLGLVGNLENCSFLEIVEDSSRFLVSEDIGKRLLGQV